MGCEVWIEAISALADGEAPGVDQRLVEAHVARCPRCRAARADIETTRQSLRVAPADQMPDMAGAVVKASVIADRRSRWSLIRFTLGVVAAEIILASLPDLVVGSNGETATHATRHLGAFSVAYGVGLLVVVARPARARTMLPVARVLGATLLITGIVAITAGSVAVRAELAHLPEMFSVGLVWLLALPTPPRRFMSWLRIGVVNDEPMRDDEVI